MIVGGPAMLIGLGGGAASSQTSAEESAELDFASVQRYVLIVYFSNPPQQAGFKTSVRDPCLFIHDYQSLG